MIIQQKIYICRYEYYILWSVPERERLRHAPGSQATENLKPHRLGEKTVAERESELEGVQSSDRSCTWRPYSCLYVVKDLGFHFPL